MKIPGTIEAICKSIEHHDDWDVATSVDNFHFYILRAAQNVGRFEPFTADEARLNLYLAHRMAGKRLCDFAWRSFAASYTEFLTPHGCD